MQKKFHFSIYGAHLESHGGVKRSNQLCEMAKAKGLEVIYLPVSKRKVLSRIIKSPVTIVYATLFLMPGVMSHLTLIGILESIIYSAWFLLEIRARNVKSISFEIGPNAGIMLANIALKLNILGDVYPHNIEYMVPNQIQKYFRSPDHAYAAEMKVYRSSNEVYAISDFDAAVLRSQSIDRVKVLSYIPEKFEFSRLQLISERRKNLPQYNGILILGTAYNPPTYAGIFKLLQLIKEQDSARSYVLAGFGTEMLVSAAPKNVEVRGCVSDIELNALLVSSQALLVYQVPTSGMLTRIIEARIAGIPVYVIGGYIQTLFMRDDGIHLIKNLSTLPLDLVAK